MVKRECIYCLKTDNLTRFLDGGVKYKCNTLECNNTIEELKLTEYRKEKEEEERERLIFKKTQEEKWGDYICEKQQYFIKADKQYRDAHVRYVDPFKKIIFKQSTLMDKSWYETNEKLTYKDQQNLEEELINLSGKGMIFN